MLSIHSRLLLVATFVLAGFLGLTGWTLDNAYRESAETALKERVEAYMYAVIAASELRDDAHLHMPEDLPDARFSTPGSGLYASVQAHDNSSAWRSKSSLGVSIPYPVGIERGSSQFVMLKTSSGQDVLTFNFGLAWAINGKERAFTFSVAESMNAFDAQVAAFRHSLWGSLLAGSILLLAAQGTILRWGLAPLRRLTEGLRAVEHGESENIAGRFPKELAGLSAQLNAFIANERTHLDRHRNALGELAHSLKTPLAVLQGTLEQSEGATVELNDELRDQISRMRQIVDYHLQRAATSGRFTLKSAVDVESTVQRLVAGLQKVYQAKNIVHKLNVEPTCTFDGEQGDLMEVLGNLLDNAFKWAKSSVVASAIQGDSDSSQSSRVLTISIEDDGPGIDESLVEHVLQRGGRASDDVPGQGIGLAVVRDIVEVYGGSIRIERSPLGGARVAVEFPPRVQSETIC